MRSGSADAIRIARPEMRGHGDARSRRCAVTEALDHERCRANSSDAAGHPFSSVARQRSSAQAAIIRNLTACHKEHHDRASSPPCGSGTLTTREISLPLHETEPNNEPETTLDAQDAEDATLARTGYVRLQEELSKVIVGQNSTIQLMATALFAGGHSILVGVPGLAKTLLVNSLSKSLSLSFKRIQFTPDLMPSDITGTDIIQENAQSGGRDLKFLKGPVFTNILLADEINRAPPRTQAALLEAMQEHSVTAGDHTMPLPEPFVVFATQNPIEQEGTYNLPEAQLDRFLLAIQVSYPTESEELAIMKGPVNPGDVTLTKILKADDILRIRNLVPRVPVGDHVYAFALNLIRCSRPDNEKAPAEIRQCLVYGAGPRAAKDLIQAARARALLEGRSYVTTSDVEALAGPVLEHRLVTNFHAQSEGITPAALVSGLIEVVRAAT